MNTKKIKLALLAVMFCFGLMVFTTSSSADGIKAGDLIQLGYGSAHEGSGGEFRITGPFPVPTTYDFETFCLEKDEYFSPGSQYTVASISNTAFLGGINTDGGDPLDDKTAWLYWMFRTSPSVLGYDNDNDDAGALQNAIWFIENEITSLPTTGDATTWFNNASDAVAGGWINNGRVAVVNLVGNNSTDYKQSQLTLVPEPSILLLLGFGLIGLAGLRRKFKK